MGLTVSYVRLKEETQPFPFLCDFFLFPFVYNFERESRFLVLIYISMQTERYADMYVSLYGMEKIERVGMDTG